MSDRDTPGQDLRPGLLRVKCAFACHWRARGPARTLVARRLATADQLYLVRHASLGACRSWSALWGSSHWPGRAGRLLTGQGKTSCHVPEIGPCSNTRYAKVVYVEPAPGMFRTVMFDGTVQVALASAVALSFPFLAGLTSGQRWQRLARFFFSMRNAS